MKIPEPIFFCGVGGSGMSPLARLMAARGAAVIGSDRSYDTGKNKPFFDLLTHEGITLVPQDGEHLDSNIGTFVVTRAVEDSIPDIKRAKELGLRILKRPSFMAELFSETENIAVGGTSGKSTTTGMIGHILKTLGKDPTIMNGAIMLNGETNFCIGKSNFAVFEADESDGYDDVIAVCPSSVSVLTNISLDHFELDELQKMFGGFISKAKIGAVLNADCANSLKLKDLNSKVVTFGESETADFSLKKYSVDLIIPGEHNKLNALAAIAACSLLGIKPDSAIEALKSFKGIKRRLELVGEVNGIKVIDDFASNPGKISASLSTAQLGSKRTFVVFQPHGFQPTKMMKDGYIETFCSILRANDKLIMPDIFYAGGTANIVNGQVVELPKDISSNDIVKAVNAKGKSAEYIAKRSEILPFLKRELLAGDTVIVMGSRDESLSEFAREVVGVIR